VVAGPWRTLGISPTDDVSAIRAAYAARLKAIDPDQEVEGFARLRRARDQALGLARQKTARSEPEATPAPDDAPPLQPALTIAAPVIGAPAAGAVLTAVAHDGARPWRFTELAGYPTAPSGEGGLALAPPMPAVVAPFLPRDAAEDHVVAFRRTENHAAAIYELLHNDERGDNRRAVALQDHFRAAAAELQGADIGVYADAERWFAEVIAASFPRSDPLLDPAVEFFGWAARRGSIHNTPAVAAILARQADWAFVREITTPGHRFKRAWTELTSPSTFNSRRGWGMRRSTVQQLLATIRRDHPSLESALDFHRVTLWDGPRTGWLRPGMIFRYIAGGYFALMVLGTLFHNASSDPARRETVVPATLNAPVADEQRDIQAAIDAAVGRGLDVAAIEKTNPRFAAMLHSNWQIAKQEGTPSYIFVSALVPVIRQRIADGQRRASHDLIAAIRTNDLAMARQVRLHGPAQCVDFFSGQSDESAFINQDLLDRAATLNRRVLLEADGDPPAKPWPAQFRIDPDAFAAAATNAHLSKARLQQALLGKGDLADRCAARIGLYESALALPGDRGTDLLRNL